MLDNKLKTILINFLYLLRYFEFIYVGYTTDKTDIFIYYTNLMKCYCLIDCLEFDVANRLQNVALVEKFFPFVSTFAHRP